MPSVVTQRFIKCHDKLRAENRVRSSRQFALALDYLPQSLSEIVNGRRDVTIELLRKAVETFQLNPVYLYTGEGPMFMEEEDLTSFRILTVVSDGEEEERIVHVPVPAQAGYAGESTDSAFIQDLPTFSLPDYKYRVGTHRSFDVSGDSMEPTLHEGDKVVCSYLDPSTWTSAIKDDYVYVIVTRGDVLVKRVVNRIKEEKALLLKADNDFYKPFTIPLGDVREMWYVRVKISPFLSSPEKLQQQMHLELKELQQLMLQQNEVISQLQKSVQLLLKKQTENSMTTAHEDPKG